MKEVFVQGHAGSNLIRRELGEDTIPMSFNIFQLKILPERIPYVIPENMIASLLCVTYIPHENDRLETSHTGFYINVYPWILWKRGKPIPEKLVFENERAKFLTADERALKKEHKKAGVLKAPNFKRLQKQYENRCSILRKLGIDVKKANRPKL